MCWENMGAVHLCAYIFYLIDMLMQGVMAMKQGNNFVRDLNN
jgi:hypothetical protein